MANIVFIAPNFAVAGQLEAEDFAEIARIGFGTVINNRPDGEEDAQLRSDAAADHALRAGLNYHHVPAGKLDLFSDPVVDAVEAAIGSGGPVLAYCKSGTRSAIIWAAASARKVPLDEVLSLLSKAGFDFDFLSDELEEQAAAAASRRAAEEKLREAA
jgi:sulfide:quinone oxidoreductase